MKNTELPVLRIGAGAVSLKELRVAGREPVRVVIEDEAIAKIKSAQKVVDKVLDEGRTVYGINTGFGLLAQTRIPPDQVEQLQRNLILSHSAGTGPLMDDNTVRLMMILKIISLCRGYSGVRPALVENLAHLINHQIYPCVPSKGSVGASGDLAPLSHMTCALIGVGEVRFKGNIMPATEGLSIAGLEPMTLGPKEGLGMINGTQASTALALIGLFSAEDVFAAGLVAGALSTEALKGSVKPYDPRIHEARGQKGQILTASIFRRLLQNSPIGDSHTNCDKVQDPYSLRCQPQVMGACWDTLRHTARILSIEANAVTDNPLIFTDDGDVISGGNFHAEPVAMAADILALSISEVGAISERRTAILVDPKMSGLPAFLVKNSGVNSGFMIAQVTAAALASENKSLAHPASVDSLPTSANQEDHVSMATFAARRLGEMADNTAGILAIELLGAAQGIEFHRPLKTTESLEEVMTAIRDIAAPYEEDRFFAPDIEAVKALIHQGLFLKWVRDDLFGKPQ